jgi:MOSC domain-containing protein YiiM
MELKMNSKARKLGVVEIVQVQPSGLKHEVEGIRIYDPARRVEVSRLHVQRHGVEGENSRGERLVDIHHLDHPDSHHREGNAVSIGFTAHYREMRGRFGEHMQDGTAGENIIIACDDEIWLPDLGRVVEFHNPDSGDMIVLEVTRIAAPCDPFSHFAADNPEGRLAAEVLKETLQYLGDGRRGFLLKLEEGQHAGVIQPGDIAYTRD